MILLEFGNERDGYKKISTYVEVADIYKYINTHHKLYYIRSWQEDKYTVIDYGSNVQFYRYKTI